MRRVMRRHPVLNFCCINSSCFCVFEIHRWVDDDGTGHMTEGGTACSQLSMFERAQELINMALHECNGVTQWARFQVPGRVAGTGRSLLRKLALT